MRPLLGGVARRGRLAPWQARAVADVSVRAAGPADAEAMAAVQLAAWRASYARAVPAALLDALDPADVAESWRDAILRPPDPRAQVLVALDGLDLVGFATTAPALDDDVDAADTAELGTLLVLPDARGRGHGSRLLAAVAARMRAAGHATALAWLPEDDATGQRFLEGAGWARDGARRTLEGGPRDPRARMTEVRLHTDLGPTLD